MNQRSKTLFIAQFGILLALEALFCFTPLGSLPAIGPIVATLMMLPVCITAVLLGTKAGVLMGFFSGLFSFLVWTFVPPSPLTAFLFTPFYTLGEFSGNLGSLLICFVPRTLTGLVTGVVYTASQKWWPGKKVLQFSLSSALGSLTNTLGVMLGIWLFFGTQYTSLVGSTMLAVIAATVLTSGIPEAIVCAAATAAVCRPAQFILAKRH